MKDSVRFDQDSLHMVIDALATLQSEQGKTVGVISHTAKMSAGISTQICITPTGNGCSRLQVQNTFLTTPPQKKKHLTLFSILTRPVQSGRLRKRIVSAYGREPVTRLLSRNKM